MGGFLPPFFLFLAMAANLNPAPAEGQGKKKGCRKSTDRFNLHPCATLRKIVEDFPCASGSCRAISFFHARRSTSPIFHRGVWCSSMASRPECCAKRRTLRWRNGLMEQSTLFGECSHQKMTMVKTPAGPHYAKLVCFDCGKFLRWIPKPETMERQKENAAILTALSKLPHLPSWERQFVRNLTSRKHISPGQQAKLLQLRDALLGRGNAHDGLDGVQVSPDRNPANHL
jgi:hypothetical protein